MKQISYLIDDFDAHWTKIWDISYENIFKWERQPFDGSNERRSRAYDYRKKAANASAWLDIISGHTNLLNSEGCVVGGSEPQIFWMRAHVGRIILHHSLCNSLYIVVQRLRNTSVGLAQHLRVDSEGSPTKTTGTKMIAVFIVYFMKHDHVTTMETLYQKALRWPLAQGDFQRQVFDGKLK